MQQPLSIEVSFDLICPWCLIGKRHLEAALAQLRAQRPGLAVEVEWRSQPLIPDTPPEGIPYRDFYVARLGSPEAVTARQAQVQAAAREAGLSLALTRIETFPSTLLAHRLVRHARDTAGPEAAARLIEELFTRYFLHAENIGDPQVLAQSLRACGVDAPKPLAHDAGWLPPLPLPRYGGAGVPYFVFDQTYALSGAVPPAILLQAMHAVLARRASQR